MSTNVKIKGTKKLLELFKELKTPIDRTTAAKVGLSIKSEMKNLISKGISPILENGRFPGYKAQLKINSLKNSKFSSSEISNVDGDLSDEDISSMRSVNKKINKKISDIKNSGYPYNLQHKYPSKNVRPVNLKLTGKFLDSLTYEVIKGSLGYATEIFYKGKQEDLKEQGHREGTNGQPKRPTIPQKGEDFAARIKRLYSKIYKDRINRILKK